MPIVVLAGAALLLGGAMVGVAAAAWWQGRGRAWLQRSGRNASRTPGGGSSDLARDLAVAIGHGQLFLVHQPKMHARSGAIVGVETLVRWQHPTRGLIGPNDFIGLAEQNGLIESVTDWVIRQTVVEQRGLAECGHRLSFNVNVSPRILANKGFAQRVLAQVAEAAGPIGLEITETVMIADADGALRNLHLFADAGIKIAIDDYGAGLSSLAYLKQLPAHELKIDRMFVSGLSSSHRDPLLVRSTIDLAHALDMEVTAEGVDSPAAMALLRVMGCDFVQGFLIATPMSLGALREFLDARTDAAAEAAPQGFSWIGRMKGS